MGLTIWREIARIATDPTDEEKEKWLWAGNTDPQAKILEIAEVYEDTSFIAEFVTPNVCQKAKLFNWEKANKNQVKVTSKEAEEIRQRLVLLHSNMGIPKIEIVDADGLSQGELWLEHRHEGIGLDREYAEGTLSHLTQLWLKPVVIKSISSKGQDVWFRSAPSQSVKKSDKPPTKD